MLMFELARSIFWPQNVLQARHDFLVDLAEDTLLRVAIPMTAIQKLHVPHLQQYPKIS